MELYQHFPHVPLAPLWVPGCQNCNCNYYEVIEKVILLFGDDVLAYAATHLETHLTKLQVVYDLGSGIVVMQVRQLLQLWQLLQQLLFLTTVTNAKAPQP
jgi:hypothetical protein